MIFRILVLTLLLSGTAVFAQFDFNFRGYVTDIPIYQSMDGQFGSFYDAPKNSFVNLTRLRLKPEFFIGNNLRFNLEYEISAYYAGNVSSSLNEPAKTNRQLVDLIWKPVSEDHYNVIHFIDRLYFRYGFEFGNIIVGRQRISWGAGRIWNPVDLFNPLNPITFYKLEKDGADAISALFYMGDFTDLNLVFNPSEKIGESNFGFRFRTNYGEYDFSLIGGRFDNRKVIGADFAGNLFDAGVRGEGIYSYRDSGYLKFILGADYQFSPKLYGLVEYHYNGEGKTDKENYDLFRLLKGEIINLSRHYLAVMTSYQIHPLTTISLTTIRNFNDNSGYIMTNGVYSASDNMSISLGALITYGDFLSEFGYYPKALFLQADYYF
ncbi:hypothetical protein MROS_1668 [Melioribacter roseus P3M-2]|uniref:Alginate export domain-containing protein n=1 Tax=Melioribacter roseus (strain DSM 23840 / JCM 17771 / VKM B-2668 / P3M-2) TaxID=1191523 RepID=I6YWH7_MELRP|nr:hypothetical protein [Melioribacter roseus]AFN74902.1 hypothetical protein MROS_1668 [Melioribacter roseus P3M-2]